MWLLYLSSEVHVLCGVGGFCWEDKNYIHDVSLSIDRFAHLFLRRCKVEPFRRIHADRCREQVVLRSGSVQSITLTVCTDPPWYARSSQPRHACRVSDAGDAKDREGRAWVVSEMLSGAVPKEPQAADADDDDDDVPALSLVEPLGQASFCRYG